MVDLAWNLLTDASQNFGNALTNAAGQVRQHRETDRNRTAVRNYLANPDDKVAFSGLAERNPELAFQIQDHHLQAASRLSAQHQQQLDTLGQLLTDERGQPIGADQYPQFLALARRAGIDTTGYETYDPTAVAAVVQLHSKLHPGDDYTLGRGDIRYRGSHEIARGAAPPSQIIPIAPGGRAGVLTEPWPDGPAPSTPASPTAPPQATAEDMRPPNDPAPAFHASPPGYVPSAADNIVYVNSFEEAAALPPGTRFMMVGETNVRTRH